MLWGAETAGYAIPINFLLKAQHIADLVRAADARVLVALGPHPQLDIWEKALEVAKLLPGVKLGPGICAGCTRSGRGDRLCCRAKGAGWQAAQLRSCRQGR